MDGGRNAIRMSKLNGASPYKINVRKDGRK